MQSPPILQAARDTCSCFTSPCSFPRGNPSPHKMKHQSTSTSKRVGKLWPWLKLYSHTTDRTLTKKTLPQSSIRKVFCLHSCQSTAFFFKVCQTLDPIHIKYQLTLLRQFLCLKMMCWLVPSLPVWMENLHILLSFQVTYRCPMALKTEGAHIFFIQR